MSRPPLGRLIAETRRRRGYSQTRLAALLCAAAEVTTVTRHEVSRWERGDRLPGAQWLAWLALVLDLPPAWLAAAARPVDRSAPTDGVTRLHRLAEQWLRHAVHGDAAPGESWRLADLGAARSPAGSGHAAAGSVHTGWGRFLVRPGDREAAQLDRHIAELRRMDDLVGGADLAPVAHRCWSQAADRLHRARGADRRRLLRPTTELAQLAGWTAADAGDRATALRAYRAGLVLAMEADDTALGGHVLGGASHLLCEADPRAAWRLARIAAAGTRRVGSPGLRALLAHRAALAAARAGDGRAAADGLLVARRLGDRVRPEHEPSWLYWLDQTELAAMTGRCLVVLDRPVRALPLLEQPGLRRPRRGQPRTRAVYAGWLARALLGVGEVEQACAVGADAAVEAVRAGSVRAAEQTRELSVRLAARTQTRAVRDLSELITQLTSYLPGSSTRPGVN
ncbi:helix-turn-helix domain-containing protein [Catellatospora sichuanensis]|uniref:helix-turn-helix domain-containing protein n=1 Tax=Catellatospora sichuanensis TaxID=1969805 RepID=UPI0011841179|nr:helix-turn-helix domain-containing protein [Catellatospora sichuanensis]